MTHSPAAGPYRSVMALQELWDGEMQGRVVDGVKVLLVKLDGRVHAYEDRCAHLGLPLSSGDLVGDVIVCKAHHYRYDARTGCGVNPRTVRLRPLSVVVDAGTIRVAVGPER